MSRLKKLSIGALCLVVVPFFLTRDTAVPKEQKADTVYDTVQSEKRNNEVYWKNER